MYIIIAIIGIPVFFLLMFFIIMYNTLVGKKNQVQNVYGSIDALLKKRYDLIPNLVSTVKTYMKHEREVLTQITELRAKAVSGSLSEQEKMQLDSKMGKLLGGIMVAVENYPDLKANQNFLHLQSTLNEVEEQISAARRAYNAAVTDYNNSVEMFPTNIVAGMIGYKRKAVFEIDESERKNINVNKLFNE